MAAKRVRPAGADSAAQVRSGGLFESYRPPPNTTDELFEAPGRPRAEVESVVGLLDSAGAAEFRARQKIADVALLRGGITFSVYSDSRGVEKIFPFDLIPRAVSATEWDRLRRGLEQRVTALGCFLDDVYGPQAILDAGVVPRRLVEGSRGFVPVVRDVKVPGRTRIHVAGIDLIRSADGVFRVLEDNIRTPSGVSYVLENRSIMKRVYPRIFDEARVVSVDEYPVRLREALAATAPRGPDGARIVILTPGPFNSAYFEHSFLARRMGVELVQGSDLFTWNDRVWVKTTHGAGRVDVIYRRVDDSFLDPTAFRPDSMLGVPGLFSAWKSGHVTLANAIGNGVADDKAIYPYVPDMIRFYLAEEPLIEQVPTFICERDADRDHVLSHMSELVVKAVDESGGYGMLMGPQATREQIEEHAARVRANPRGYIAQPLVQLSTCPTWDGRGIVARRVDLRPYVVTGASPWVLPGGLTRVALVEGSYVVNSSQGGGSKDTWVLGGAP